MDNTLAQDYVNRRFRVVPPSIVEPFEWSGFHFIRPADDALNTALAALAVGESHVSWRSAGATTTTDLTR